MKKTSAAVLFVLVALVAAGCSNVNPWVTRLREEDTREMGIEANKEYLEQQEERFGKPPGFSPAYPSNEEYMDGYHSGYYSGYGEGKQEGMNGEPYAPSLKGMMSRGKYEEGYVEGYYDGYITGFSDGTFAADIGADLSEGGYEEPDGGSGSTDFELSTDYKTGYEAGLAKGFTAGKADKEAGYGYHDTPNVYDIIGNEEHQRGFKDGYKQGYNEGYNGT